MGQIQWHFSVPLSLLAVLITFDSSLFLELFPSLGWQVTTLSWISCYLTGYSCLPFLCGSCSISNVPQSPLLITFLPDPIWSHGFTSPA